VEGSGDVEAGNGDEVVGEEVRGVVVHGEEARKVHWEEAYSWEVHAGAVRGETADMGCDDVRDDEALLSFVLLNPNCE